MGFYQQRFENPLVSLDLSLEFQIFFWFHPGLFRVRHDVFDICCIPISLEYSPTETTFLPALNVDYFRAHGSFFPLEVRGWTKTFRPPGDSGLPFRLRTSSGRSEFHALENRRNVSIDLGDDSGHALMKHASLPPDVVMGSLFLNVQFFHLFGKLSCQRQTLHELFGGD